jgi:dihydroxyacetone kinase-like protein
MEHFANAGNAGIVMLIIEAIKKNKAYLSEIDGKIGDGDHGINMNKGFSMAGEQITSEQSFSDAMKILGDTLLFNIGGSMGPIYGTFFRTASKSLKGQTEITAELLDIMLNNILQDIKSIGGAKAGDKTLIDTLEPVVSTFNKERTSGKTFAESMASAIVAAKEGRDSTIDMVARIGRSSRLGERSRGVLDAGAASCYIIIETMFNAASAALNE